MLKTRAGSMGTPKQNAPKKTRDTNYTHVDCRYLFPGLPEVVHRHGPQSCREVDLFSEPGNPGLIQLVRLLVCDAHHGLAAHLTTGANQVPPARPRKIQKPSATRAELSKLSALSVWIHVRE